MILWKRHIKAVRFLGVELFWVNGTFKRLWGFDEYRAAFHFGSLTLWLPRGEA